MPDTLVDRCKQKVDEAGLQALTDSERSLYAIWWFYVETNNGTIHQFFSNESGALAHDALRGLIAFGAKETACILARAMSVFPYGEVPPDFHERNRILESLSGEQTDLLDELSSRFYESDEDVSGLADAYIDQHRGDFPLAFVA